MTHPPLIGEAGRSGEFCSKSIIRMEEKPKLEKVGVTVLEKRKLGGGRYS